MSSNESAAYEIMRSLDVDYVLIIFGGVIGYSGDDINKFLWMVRIAEGEHPKDIRVSETSSYWAVKSVFPLQLKVSHTCCFENSYWLYSRHFTHHLVVVLEQQQCKGVNLVGAECLLVVWHWYLTLCLLLYVRLWSDLTICSCSFNFNLFCFNHSLCNQLIWKYLLVSGAAHILFCFAQRTN